MKCRRILRTTLPGSQLEIKEKHRGGASVLLLELLQNWLLLSVLVVMQRNPKRHQTVFLWAAFSAKNSSKAC
jgi:hypothetical protein